MAIDNGVDQILFKSTFTQYYSPREFEEISYIHPNVEYMDLKNYVYIKLEEVKKAINEAESLLADGQYAKVIPVAIDIAQRIVRRVVMGIGSKTQYNEFDLIKNYDLIFNSLEAEDGEVVELYRSLRHTFGLLAEAYEHTHGSKTARFYLSLYNRGSKISV